MELAQPLRAKNHDGANQQIIRFYEGGGRKPFDSPELANEELRRWECIREGVGDRLDHDGFWPGIDACQHGAIDGSPPLFICRQPRHVAGLPAIVWIDQNVVARRRRLGEREDPPLKLLQFRDPRLMAMLFPVAQKLWPDRRGNVPIGSELGIQPGEVGDDLLVANHKEWCIVFLRGVRPELTKERSAHWVPSYCQMVGRHLSVKAIATHVLLFSSILRRRKLRTFGNAHAARRKR